MIFFFLPPFPNAIHFKLFDCLSDGCESGFSFLCFSETTLEASHAPFCGGLLGKVIRLQRVELSKMRRKLRNIAVNAVNLLVIQLEQVHDSHKALKKSRDSEYNKRNIACHNYPHTRAHEYTQSYTQTHPGTGCHKDTHTLLRTDGSPSCRRVSFIQPGIPSIPLSVSLSVFLCASISISLSLSMSLAVYLSLPHTHTLSLSLPLSVYPSVPHVLAIGALPVLHP